MTPVIVEPIAAQWPLVTYLPLTSQTYYGIAHFLLLLVFKYQVVLFVGEGAVWEGQGDSVQRKQRSGAEYVFFLRENASKDVK